MLIDRLAQNYLVSMFKAQKGWDANAISPRVLTYLKSRPQWFSFRDKIEPNFYNLEVIRFFFDWKLLPMSKFMAIFDEIVDADVAFDLSVNYHCIPVMKGKVWLLPSSILPTDFLNLLSKDVENFYICPAYEASFSDLKDKQVYDNWLNDSFFHRNIEVKSPLENKHSNL